MSEPQDLILLGRLLGTFAGWDQLTEEAHIFYNFVPAPDVSDLSPGDLIFNFEEGNLYYTDASGNITLVFDAVTVCRELQRISP